MDTVLMTDLTKQSTPEELDRIMWSVSIPGAVVRILVRSNDALRTEVAELRRQLGAALAEIKIRDEAEGK